MRMDLHCVVGSSPTKPVGLSLTQAGSSNGRAIGIRELRYAASPTLFDCAPISILLVR